MPPPLADDSVADGLAAVIVIVGIAATSVSAGATVSEAEAVGNALGDGKWVVDSRRCSGGSRVAGIGGLGAVTITGGATRPATGFCASRIDGADGRRQPRGRE